MSSYDPNTRVYSGGDSKVLDVIQERIEAEWEAREEKIREEESEKFEEELTEMRDEFFKDRRDELFEEYEVE